MICNKKTFLFITLVLVAFVLAYFDVTTHLSFQSLQKNHSELHYRINQAPVATSLTFFCIYIFATAFSIPGAATILTLAAGALFNFTIAIVLVSFASAIGATGAFLFSRALLKEWVQRRFAKELNAINRGWSAGGSTYLFSLRLIPFFPYFVVNLIAGVLPLGICRFYIVSQIGMLPAVSIYVNAGSQLAKINKPSDVMTLDALVSLTLLGLLALLPKVHSIYKTKRMNQ